MDEIKLDKDIEFKSDKGIRIDKYIKVEKGAIYNDGGYVTQNNYPDDNTAKHKAEAKDDEDIHMAIDNLYSATDEKGEKIFTDQGQWYAVYRVLKEYFNYPDKMTDFVVLVKKSGWAMDEPLCKYDSIRSINTNLPLLSVKVSLWQQHKNVNDKYHKQCVVAEKLMKLLEIL